MAYETDLLEYEDLFDNNPAVEARVEALKTGARHELANLESMGGAIGAIDYMKAQLVNSNADRLTEIETGATVVVGVNRWTEAELSPLMDEDGGIMVVDPAVGLAEFQARELAFSLGLRGKQVAQFVTMLRACYRAYRDLDALREPAAFAGWFRRIVLKDPLKMKQLQKGVVQLSEEGATQVFRPFRNNDLVLGAVGVLQFDVAAHRLKGEYGVEAVVEPVGVQAARWVVCDDDKELKRFREKAHENLALDGDGQLVYLAPTRVNLQLTQERWPDIEFAATRETTIFAG